MMRRLVLTSATKSKHRAGRGVLTLRNSLVWLLDVRYAPIATKFCIAAKCRDVPKPEMATPASIYQLVGGHEQTGDWGNV